MEMKTKTQKEERLAAVWWLVFGPKLKYTKLDEIQSE